MENELIFSAMLKECIIQPMEGRNKTYYHVLLKLKSIEREPQTLILRLNGGKMAEQIAAINPTADKTMVTAYVEFKTYTDEESQRECQKIQAYRLHLQDLETKNEVTLER